MDKNDMEKICKNCKYYIAHYTKGNTNLVRLHQGHCAKYIIADKKEEQTCDRWESNELLVKQREEQIQNALLRMAKDISDIRLILKDNNS